jgi:hypothetical protein
MFEVLLADIFQVCLRSPSTGPDILIFKRFREKWSDLNHDIFKQRTVPLIIVSDQVKEFILEHCNKSYPREDYREFICLAGLMVGLDVKANIRKPGALHRARWMAKAIYSLKIELLFNGNEQTFPLTGCEFQGVQRFNRFVVTIYIQSWFTSRLVVDAPINDLLLIQRLKVYDDDALKSTGLKMMKRHSWYLRVGYTMLIRGENF